MTVERLRRISADERAEICRRIRMAPLLAGAQREAVELLAGYFDLATLPPREQFN